MTVRQIHMGADRIQVRDARSDDHAALQALRQEVTNALRRIYLPKEEVSGLRRVMPRFDTLVAIVDGELIGTLEYTLAHEAVYLQGLGVAEAWQGQGVARRLVDAAAALADRYPLPRLELCTIRETGNVQVFERLGFTVCDEAPSTQFVGAVGQPVSEVMMMKQL
ncbi:MAG: GNAT family N-acetyltransferase [Alcanivorax sp.]|nr:GNAT family N-acetyltransferase [Alcanivorax sp.]